MTTKWADKASEKASSRPGFEPSSQDRRKNRRYFRDLLFAGDAKAATKKALAQIRSWALPHKDNVFEVEKAVDVTAMMSQYGFSLKLTKATEEKPFTFTCGYVPIGK